MQKYDEMSATIEARMERARVLRRERDEVLVEAREILVDDLSIDTGCDHDVGICRCGMEALVDDLADAIASVSTVRKIRAAKEAERELATLVDAYEGSFQFRVVTTLAKLRQRFELERRPI